MIMVMDCNGIRAEHLAWTYLHADDGVDEEQHGDKQTNVGQCLERLYERPQQNANGVALTQQLDQSSGTEQSQKAHIECVGLRMTTRMDDTKY